MPYNYTISLTNVEVDQILKVLYYQQSVTDDTAINLLAKLNRAIHERNGIRGSRQPSQRDLDLSRVATAETYHRYRAKRLQTSNSEMALSNSTTTEISPAANNRTVEAIASSLDTIANCLINQQQQLGFGITPGKRMIYCDGSQSQTWYYLSEQQQPIPIGAPALTCRVQGVEFLQQQQRWKTHCHVQADRLYCLESDYNSPFSKALLLAFACLSAEQLKHPITIEALPTPNQTGLTCRVYAAGVQILNKFGKTPKWKDVARQAIKHVEIANGRLPGKLAAA
jgi:hypothetical protein